MVLVIEQNALWSRVMELGRQLERGTVNQMTGPEIAELMERFGEDAFQIQVWADLAVTKYKLYDAVGMWIGSERFVAPSTRSEVLAVGQEYVDRRLMPGYFERLRRGDPSGRPDVKSFNYATRGFVNLPQEDQLRATAEFCRQSLRKEDWFYSLSDGRVLAAENETGTYTLMLAEEY